MSQHFGLGTVRVCLATTKLLTPTLVLILTSSFAQAQSLPTGWSGANIGGATPAGTATYASSVFTIEGGGRRVYEAADQFYFVYRQLTGDGTMVARIGSVENVNAYTKAGVMMRESLATGSRHAFASVSPGQGIQFNRRLATDGASTISSVAGTAPVWLRLVRSGSTISASYSPDGTVWTAVGSETVSMAATIYVGLAVSSYNTSSLATATFSSVNVAGSTGAPTGALPSGWIAADIGTPAATGTATYSSGAYAVTAGGIDIWGSSDQFRYVYRQMSGDVDVVARVASLQGPHEWSKAGIMVRTSLNPNAANVMAFTSLARGVAMQTRPDAGLLTTQSGRVSGTAPVWLKIERRGSALTTFWSSDGNSWTMMGSSTLTLGSSFYVGLAVTAHATAGTAAAQFTGVAANAAGGTPTNTPPTVSLTSPASGATYTAPATVSIAANATDTNGVALVEFYANGTLLGSDSTSPYAFSWSSVPAGSYTLTAVARDTAGATTTSSARSITVGTSSSNTPPTVSLTAPANGASYLAPASVTISANAADTNGTIARVDFYAGSLLVGSDTTSPYSVTWSNAAAGSYSLTAVARDNAGATTTSASRSITITATAALTTAVFTPSADHSVVTRYVLDIFTSGANPATATPMATRDLGKPAVVNGSCSADIATTLASLPSGNYFATVVAVGSGGTSTRATSAVFTR